MLRIGVLGANGRMGRELLAAAARADDVAVGGASVRAGAAVGEALAGVPVTTEPAVVARGSDVLVDFTAPAALPRHLEAAVEERRPILVGTTGLGPAEQELLDAAARRVAVLQAANTSLGVNLLAMLVEAAAARLGVEWDIEIAEMHHRRKVDAPSGTALLLGEAAARGRGVELQAWSVRSRDGITGPRVPGSIGFASLRGGTVAGEHLVVFAGQGERVELGHRAETRSIFADGALAAARWLAGKPPGRYSMRDVLGAALG